MTAREYVKLAKEITGKEGKYIGASKVEFTKGDYLQMGQFVAIECIDLPAGDLKIITYSKLDNKGNVVEQCSRKSEISTSDCRR